MGAAKILVCSLSMQLLLSGTAAAQDIAYKVLECAADTLISSTLFETRYHQGMDGPSLSEIRSMVKTAGALVTIIEQDYGTQLDVENEAIAVLDGRTRGFEVTAKKHGGDFAAVTTLKRYIACKDKFSGQFERANAYAREQNS